jgi:hypothetical protein
VLRRTALISLIAPAVLTLPGCDSIYYKTMKRFGVEKRDILVKRVREARQSQDQAKEEFRTALERFKAVVEVEGSSLEDKYTALSRELERSEDRARAVKDRIDAVENVAGDLFREWQKELGQYSDRRLRAESERELRETRRRTDAVIAAMKRAEQRLEPVLRPLRDRVLFLKHNLNARALGALDRELAGVQGSVDTLLADLERSIAEADAFIKTMESEAREAER